MSQKKLEKLEAKAIKITEEELETEEDTEASYYKDKEEIEEEQNELRQVEEEYIQNLKDNLEQMRKDQKSGKKTYKNWRDKIPYVIVKDLSLLDGDSGNVDLNGELFGIDKPRSLRNGKTLLTFGVGNSTGAINVKAMEGDYITAEDLESYKNGMFARIAGYMSVDKYTNQPVLEARAIELLPPPELRKDEEEKKRVELHLHTKMSIMDGVTNFKTYCELAKNMGHTAIRDTVALRQQFADRFVKLAEECGRTGEPMIRNLEYAFPHCGYAGILDQFMMGDFLMVAPQIYKGATSREVAIPPGRWLADDGSVVTGPTNVVVDTPLSRLPHFVRQSSDIYSSIGTPPPPPGIEGWKFREELAKPSAALQLPPVGKGKTPWLENRISRCFFSPIKRPPFNRDELMDDVDYYPDAYLRRLANEGVNGLWLSVQLRGLAETSFTKPDPGRDRRIAKLRHAKLMTVFSGLPVLAPIAAPRP